MQDVLVWFFFNCRFINHFFIQCIPCHYLKVALLSNMGYFSFIYTFYFFYFFVFFIYFESSWPYTVLHTYVGFFDKFTQSCPWITSFDYVACQHVCFDKHVSWLWSLRIVPCCMLCSTSYKFSYSTTIHLYALKVPMLVIFNHNKSNLCFSC